MSKSKDESQPPQENKTSPAKQENTPQQAGEKKVKSKRTQLTKGGARPSKAIYTETQSDKTPREKKDDPMRKRPRIYKTGNAVISGIAGFIFAIDLYLIWQLYEAKKDLSGAVLMGVLLLVGAVTFLSRAFWMKKVHERGCQITDNPDDYALERTTGFAWTLLAIMSLYGLCSGTLPGEGNLATVEKWLVTLALWTPIVSFIGSSWGKLKATKPNGDKIIWPCNWGNEGGEEKKGWWAKLKKTVDKPAYGNIALVIIQILLYAMTSAATLEQEWFIKVKFIVLIPILFVWAICTVIYCVACKGSMIAFFCLFALVFLSFVLAVVGISGLKDPVTYGLQLGLQSASLIFAVFASKEIKSGHARS